LKYHQFAKDKADGYPTLSLAEIRNTLIPLPPLTEQRAIAQVLSSARQAIETTEQVIFAARELKRSMMKYLFTYGPVPVDQADQVVLKETDIGEMPEEWDVKKLGKLAEIEYGIQATVANNTDPSIGIPILTNTNITLDGKIDLSTLRYYNLSEREQKKVLRIGDVLFNWRSGSQRHVGKSALFEIDGEYTCSSFILRFRVSDSINSQFLANELYEMWNRGYFIQQRSQSSVNSVFNKSACKELEIKYPTIVDQESINDYLSVVNHKINTELDKKLALEALFYSLLHHLMTAKIRVKNLNSDETHNISELLNHLNKLEEDVEYQKTASEGQSEIEYIPGKIPILISAPHGAVHTRKEEEKEEDEFTAGFARLVGERTGAHVIYLRHKSKTDPNWDSNVPYKIKLEKIINKKGIKFVLDIHGARGDRKFGIELGTMKGKSCTRHKEKIIEILNKHGFLIDANDNLRKLDIDKTFTGCGMEGQETIINYLQKLPKPVPAAQFELNAHLRIPSRRSDASVKQSFQGNPKLISKTIDAFVDLIHVLNQEVS
jgi:type I restriction enzyme S subunit